MQPVSFISSYQKLQGHSMIAPTTADLLSSLSKAIYLEIKEFSQNFNKMIDTYPIAATEYFSAQDIPRQYQDTNEELLTNQEEISEFLQLIDKRFKFSPEVTILTLAYIKKLSISSKIPITNNNWKNISLVSVLISQRVSDNPLISASCIASLFPNFTLESIKFMETEYLNLIHYDYNIDQNDYINHMGHLQDISKSYQWISWRLDNEKLENIIERMSWLSQGMANFDNGIVRSKRITAINLNEIEF
ncbi:unnamed protein product [Blepharisma stoltei]|uniref:Cyclin N-terminal domain-containing protein n=1 Tax=Blepharisma stoltei TaxID=1481888 RepID=A0AAU9K9D7_9CILI|nr:unnamed protein product [Blepharisma stoltei]